MKHQYRLVKVESPDAPKNKQLNNTEYNNNRNQNQEQVNDLRPSNRHPFLWAISVLTIALLVVAGVWMGHVSSSLDHLNQVGATNTKTLGNISNRISVMQLKLSEIGLKLTQLQNEIRSLFTSLMNYLSHH